MGEMRPVNNSIIVDIYIIFFSNDMINNLLFFLVFKIKKTKRQDGGDAAS